MNTNKLNLIKSAVLATILFVIANCPSSAFKYFESDSTANASDSSRVESAISGAATSGVYSKDQDKLFNYRLGLNIPFLTRAKMDIDYSEGLWSLRTREYENTPWAYFKRNFESLPSSYFTPSGEEVMQREVMLENAFAVPYVKTYNPYGLKVALHDIGLFLGLVEDVSPIIKYSLTITADVEVVVYSVQAIVVATIFKGVQSPGGYTLNWNGRDDKGRKMPAGDYIIEVRAGTERYFRKRVIIN